MNNMNEYTSQSQWCGPGEEGSKRERKRALHPDESCGDVCCTCWCVRDCASCCKIITWFCSCCNYYPPSISSLGEGESPASCTWCGYGQECGFCLRPADHWSLCLCLCIFCPPCWLIGRWARWIRELTGRGLFDNKFDGSPWILPRYERRVTKSHVPYEYFIAQREYPIAKSWYERIDQGVKPDMGLCDCLQNAGCLSVVQCSWCCTCCNCWARKNSLAWCGCELYDGPGGLSTCLWLPGMCCHTLGCCCWCEFIRLCTNTDYYSRNEIPKEYGSSETQSPNPDQD